MSQTTELYTESLLALAAYADLSKVIPEKENLKFAGMTENQVTEYGDGYQGGKRLLYADSYAISAKQRRLA
jgi:hypothetical protein